eukprot:13031710-Alexandrium_andersonii.AAC.1
MPWRWAIDCALSLSDVWLGWARLQGGHDVLAKTVPGRWTPSWLGPSVTADTWRTHLAATSHAYWHTRHHSRDDTHLNPAELFQLLVSWADTKLRIRLDERADQGY